METHWRVNSYGYPNPFSTEERPQQAWVTFLSFFDFSSYSALKGFWSSTSAPRLLDPHGVESWKANFEELGLLYVLSGSDQICITPAGRQFREAAERHELGEFAWIGLSLLLRFPLRGPPRRSRGPRYDESELLLYWYLYSALRELGDYLWWTELERVLSRVFRRDEGAAAIADVRSLRNGKSSLSNFPLPGDSGRGGFYNALNQVIVHAGMNYLLLGRSNDESFYRDTREPKIWIHSDSLPLVDLALSSIAEASECGDGSLISRMPAAPDFHDDEQGYFDYLGRSVPSIPSFESTPPIAYVLAEGGRVAILKVGVHYEIAGQREITGGVDPLCTLAVGQRVILSHDLGRSYIVENKASAEPGNVTVKIRRARPITSEEPIRALLEENQDA